MAITDTAVKALHRWVDAAFKDDRLVVSGTYKRLSSRSYDATSGHGTRTEADYDVTLIRTKEVSTGVPVGGTWQTRRVATCIVRCSDLPDDLSMDTTTGDRLEIGEVSWDILSVKNLLGEVYELEVSR